MTSIRDIPFWGFRAKGAPAAWATGIPRVPDPAADALRTLNNAIHAPAKVEMVMLPWRDGLTLVRKL